MARGDHHEYTAGRENAADLPACGIEIGMNSRALTATTALNEPSHMACHRAARSQLGVNAKLLQFFANLIVARMRVNSAKLGAMLGQRRHEDAAAISDLEHS